MTCMGLVHDFSGLAAARFFLGVAEAGLFPGVFEEHARSKRPANSRFAAVKASTTIYPAGTSATNSAFGIVRTHLSY